MNDDLEYYRSFLKELIPDNPEWAYTLLAIELLNKDLLIKKYKNMLSPTQLWALKNES